MTELEVTSENQSLFLNLSNHRLIEWSAEQRRAALSIVNANNLIDCPLPMVDPYSETAELIEAADEVISALINQYGDLNKCVAGVMVAGEPIFTVLLVKRLQSEGIRCFSATTERFSATEKGVKRSRFIFVKFREWFAL